MSERKCEPFFVIDGDAEEGSPCLCPECGEDLPRDFPLGKQFTCLECGTTLETLPVNDEDTEQEFAGLLCIVPEYAVKEVAPR